MIIFVIGFLIVFGAVGAIETDGNLIQSVFLAFVGLFLMYVGTSELE